MSEEADHYAALRKALDQSGIPFQLRIQRLIEAVATRCGVYGIAREVPARDRFVDIICRIDHCLFVFECKRTTEATCWQFVITEDDKIDETRCTLEYFGANIQHIPPGGDRVFVDDWQVQLGSPQAEFCYTPKDSTVHTLEDTCRSLLADSRQA